MNPIEQKIKEKKLAALRSVMKSLAKETKDDNIIQILGEKPLQTVERIPTGYITLDVATGGGVARGRLHELFGPESAGKSLVAQKVIASAQKLNCLCAYVDMEQTFDPMFAQKLGIMTDELIISQPASFQQAAKVIDGLIDADIDLIVVDSVAAMVPEEELDAEVGKQNVGLIARHMSQLLRRINSKIARTHSAVLFINQMRDAINAYGNPDTTPGGRALKFYSSIRMKVSKNADGVFKERKGGEEIAVGQGIRVRVVKNKTAPPFQVAEFPVYFDGRKTDEIDQIATIALAKGLLPKYNSKGELSETGRTYKWDSCPEFIASSKKDVAVQLHEFPQVAEELKQIILSGDYEGKQFKCSDDPDDELTDEEFEEKMRRDIKEAEENEAEEIVEGDWEDL